MSADLECGSKAFGRYTCKGAPRPSVCCANGCCAASPYGVHMPTGLPLWLRIFVAAFAGLAMGALFAFCLYRDHRALRAYTLLKEEEAKERRQRRDEELHRLHPTGPQNVEDEASHMPDAQSHPSLRRAA
ncbi:hypothetical protein LSCM1_05003 [Leishmania martiniquensis]|uniref:Transmembrane protein n=1 Tax=Leishmania martiniquensis TaxID=1580590 RepID=A0A836H1F5_9TRYP|nr:hypothetical protein LSCM1_05003 [Leishmania martiniquensis]